MIVSNMDMEYDRNGHMYTNLNGSNSKNLTSQHVKMALLEETKTELQATNGELQVMNAKLLKELQVIK